MVLGGSGEELGISHVVSPVCVPRSHVRVAHAPAPDLYLPGGYRPRRLISAIVRAFGLTNACCFLRLHPVLLRYEDSDQEDLDEVEMETCMHMYKLLSDRWGVARRNSVIWIKRDYI